MLKRQLLVVPWGNLYGFSHPLVWIFLLSKLMVLKYGIWAWDAGLPVSGQRCKNERINKNHALCKPYASTGITSCWLIFLM